MSIGIDKKSNLPTLQEDSQGLTIPGL